ncbi:MAG: hypothetical protein ACK5RO_02575 [Pseudobdellovibrionaceae bacterium]
MRLFILVLSWLFSLPSLAQEYAVRYTYENRQYDSQERPEDFQSLDSFSAGLRSGSFWYFLDYQTTQIESGNATLFVEQEHQALSLNPIMELQDNVFTEIYVIPYLGLIAGFHRDVVTTTLLGTPNTETGRWKGHLGALGGLRLKVPWVWASVEARVLTSESWAPSPALSVAALIGLTF